MIVGGALITTVTLKLQLALRPTASVTTQLTGVVPVGNVLPDGGVQLVVQPGQLSLDEVLHVAVVTLVTAMSAGQLMVGSSLSTTVTLKVQFVEFDASSVAVQLTGVVPFGNEEPLAGLHTRLTFVQLSLVVTV